MSEYVAELRGAIEKFTPRLERMSDYVAHFKHHLNQIIPPD